MQEHLRMKLRFKAARVKYAVFLWLRHPAVLVKVYIFRLSRPSVHSSVRLYGQILLPRYLMDGLNILTKLTGNIY